jgi:regulator of protease activity HflC (stomatin/prohibitin superfamily)
MNVSINYRIGKSASEIYKNLGLGYADTVIAPAIQNAVKQVIAQYNAQTLLDGYANASRDITDDLTTQLSNFGINVVAVNIVNHDYSSAFEQAVEAKQLAVQSALKAENDLRTIQIQAQQQIATANATAQSKILQGQADGASQLAVAQAQAQGKLLIAQAEAKALELQKQQVTPELLQLREIEVEKEYATHWQGGVPSTMMGTSAIPFLQMPQNMVSQTVN